MVFLVGKVKVRIDASFFLMLSAAALLKIQSLLLVLLFSSLHELGHITALYILGGRAGEINISFYGIGLKHGARFNKAREIIFLIGGCAVNLILALSGIYPEINFALFVINILPIYPLDGGRIAKLLFGIKNERLFTYFSFTLLIGLAAFSVFKHSLNLLMITVYLALFALNEVFR